MQARNWTYSTVYESDRHTHIWLFGYAIMFDCLQKYVYLILLRYHRIICGSYLF